MAETVTNIRETPAAANVTFSGISVVPDWGLGHPEPRGHTVAGYSQSDVVDAYAATLNEELENENVRSLPVNTRRAPALAPLERFGAIGSGYVAILCSCDFYTRDRTTNTSVVEFSGAHLSQLAQRISEALSEWGRCSSFEHRGSHPVGLNERQSFIRIKPFALNGPNADVYLRRLDALGIAVGRAIGDYFDEKNLLRKRR